MAKKKKVWKSNSGTAAFRGKEDRIRESLSQIIAGQSRLLHRPDELYEFIAQTIDDIEDFKDVQLQLELLAWTLRTDFLSFKADDEERDDWESLFYDAGTFFVELASQYDDKEYISDLIHDLALRHVGGEGRSVLFLSLNEVLPDEIAKKLIDELIATVTEVELQNREDVIDAITDMSDALGDCERYTKAALLKDPDKSNATLIDIANEHFVAGNIELAKQWLGDVRDPGAEDEEAYLDLMAAIADKEGRKSDCVKIATRLYETYPKVINLARLCQQVDEKQADTLLREHSSFRSGGNVDTEFMQLLLGLKRYSLLEQYIDMYEKDLPAEDAEILNGISDQLEKDGQKALADHIREWTVEEPEEAQAFDDRD